MKENIRNLTHVSEWSTEVITNSDPESFNPREKTVWCLSRRNRDVAMGVGAIIIGTAAINRLVQSLGIDTNVVDILNLIAIRPWR